MAHCHRVIIGALASGTLLASCREVTGPGVEGRWASTGIELVAQQGTTELRLLCAAPARLTHGLVPDSTGTIRFSTSVQPVQLGTPYRVDFLGQLVGDTLFATVTGTGDVGRPIVQTYTMLRGGDPAFDKIFCAL
jgi:hypothetical protein